MNYFYDCEFIEGFYKPLFGKRRHFIDLISIGIVCEDGRSYYAISNEWSYNDADPWVQVNVIHKLPLKIRPKESINEFRRRCMLTDDYTGPWYDGKSNKEIAREIIEFVNPSLGWPALSYNNSDLAHGEKMDKFFELHNVKAFSLEGKFDYFFAQPTFYGNYSAYDHVLLCSLFGKMIDLPPGFPMYTRDLKQMVDEWVHKAMLDHTVQTIKELQSLEKTGVPNHPTFEETLQSLKDHPNYPKQVNEHNALADARWNYELFKFMMS